MTPLVLLTRVAGHPGSEGPLNGGRGSTEYEGGTENGGGGVTAWQDVRGENPGHGTRHICCLVTDLGHIAKLSVALLSHHNSGDWIILTCQGGGRPA